MFKLAKNLSITLLVLLLGCSSTEPSANSTPVSAPEAANSQAQLDTLIIPGERVGPVTRSTTHQDLSQLFGEKNLSNEEVSLGEGFTQPGTRVNLGEKRSFTVVWSDQTRTQPLEVRNFGRDWRTRQGIGIGTPLEELREKLGEFELYGFAWDYSGTVLLKGTKLDGYDGLLFLQLTTAPDAAQTSPNDYRAVLGDQTFSSTNSHLPPLDITVGEMVVRLAPDEQ